jgi:phosphate transport system protein
VRTAYHEQLAALNTQLAEMCGLAGVAMERATRALLRADVVLAEQVIADQPQITSMNTQAQETAFVLLALQAPVAGDLRAVVSSLQTVADVNRMGALARHVAKIARRRNAMRALPAEVGGLFAEMARLTVDLSNSARDAVLSGDPRLAAQIADDDNAVDELHRRLFTVLMDREWKHDVAAAVDVTLLSRYYERFADHAVEVGRHVVFRATGMRPDDGRLTSSNIAPATNCLG